MNNNCCTFKWKLIVYFLFLNNKSLSTTNIIIIIINVICNKLNWFFINLKMIVHIWTRYKNFKYLNVNSSASNKVIFVYFTCTYCGNISCHNNTNNNNKQTRIMRCNSLISGSYSYVQYILYHIIIILVKSIIIVIPIIISQFRT